METQTFQVGQSVIWKHVPRGGWGYVFRVPAVIVSITPKRIVLEAKLQNGGVKTVRVKPDSIVAMKTE